MGGRELIILALRVGLLWNGNDAATTATGVC